MDLYKATGNLLASHCVNVGDRIYHMFLPFNAKTNQYVIAYPCITYAFKPKISIPTFSGVSNLMKVTIQVNIWGTTENIEIERMALVRGISQKRISIGQFVFSLVEADFGQDVHEQNVPVKRYMLPFKGIVEIGESNDSV